MSRELPKFKPGLTFYCESMCINDEKLLRGNYAEKYLFEAIEYCQEIFRFKLLAAKGLPDSIHLLVRTIKWEASISLIMYLIRKRIEKRYNKHMGRKGHFWENFYSIYIVEEASNPKKFLSDINEFFGTDQINNIEMFENEDNIKEDYIKDRLKNKKVILNLGRLF